METVLSVFMKTLTRHYYENDEYYSYNHASPTIIQSSQISDSVHQPLLPPNIFNVMPYRFSNKNHKNCAREW